MLRGKNSLYMLVFPESKRLDLKTLAIQLGEKRLSFVQERDLSALAMVQGAVGPLAAIGTAVAVYFDTEMARYSLSSRYC
jgi:hypothetical protein